MEQFIVRSTTKIQKNVCEDNLETMKTKSKCYLFNGKFFKIINVSDDGKNKMSAECQYCFKTVNGQKSSTGNFLSHIKVDYYLLITYLKIINYRPPRYKIMFSDSIIDFASIVYLYISTLVYTFTVIV